MISELRDYIYTVTSHPMTLRTTALQIKEIGKNLENLIIKQESCNSTSKGHMHTDFYQYSTLCG
jgi:hypothetical protein